MWVPQSYRQDSIVNRCITNFFFDKSRLQTENSNPHCNETNSLDREIPTIKDLQRIFLGTQFCIMKPDI